MRETAQQIDSETEAHLACHILLRTLMQSMIRCSCSQERAPGTQNTVADRQGNWHFADVSGTHHTQTFVVTSLSVTVNTCNDYEPIDTCVSQGSVMTLIRRGG